MLLRNTTAPVSTDRQWTQPSSPTVRHRVFPENAICDTAA